MMPWIVMCGVIMCELCDHFVPLYLTVVVGLSECLLVSLRYGGRRLVSEVWYNVMLRTAMQWQWQSIPIQSNPLQSSPTQPIQSNPVQSNPIQSNPIQSSPIQSNPMYSNVL